MTRIEATKPEPGTDHRVSESAVVGERGRSGRLSALIGMPRTGTTWLGSIINSHPEVAYRFEPFHRFAGQPGLMAVRDSVLKGEVPPGLFQTLYESLLRASPAWEKPPFFPKSYRTLPGRGLLWPLCRKTRALGKLFESLYTPAGRPHLVFKDIGMVGIRLLQWLVDEADARLVYLLRNPYAVVASLLKGAEDGLMPAIQGGSLRERTQRHAPELAGRFGDRVERMSLVQRSALYWRLECEWALGVIRGRDSALLVDYHDLCRDPLGESQRVFAHLGLSFPEQSRRFIHESTQSRPGVGRYLGPIGRRLSYFSVYRDPRQSENKWKTQLSEPQKAEIREIVEDSPAYRAYPD